MKGKAMTIRNEKLVAAFHTAETMHPAMTPSRLAATVADTFDHMRAETIAQGFKLDNMDTAENVCAEMFAYLCRSNGIDPLDIVS